MAYSVAELQRCIIDLASVQLIFVEAQVPQMKIVDGMQVSNTRNTVQAFVLGNSYRRQIYAASLDVPRTTNQPTHQPTCH